jgi:hypothetical protein
LTLQLDDIDDVIGQIDDKIVEVDAVLAELG